MAAQGDVQPPATDTGTATVEQFEEWYEGFGLPGWLGVLPGSAPLPAEYPWVVQLPATKGNGPTSITCTICDQTVYPRAPTHPDVFRFHRAHKSCAKDGASFCFQTKVYDVSRPDGHYSLRCRDCDGAFTTEDANDIQLPTHHERCGRSGRLTKRAVVAPATSSDGASTTDVRTG